MKVEPKTFQPSELIRLLKAEYGLDIARLTFVPKGEDSYGYMAETSAQVRYFVKVQEPSRLPNLEAGLRVTHHLRHHCGLPYVGQAYATGNGRFLSRYGKYAVAVFNFYEGATAFEERLSDMDQIRVAELLASLHASVQCPALPPLHQETFDLAFRGSLMAVLKATEDTAAPANDYRRTLRAWLNRERDDILATLEKVEQLGAWARRAGREPVLTHGDPTSGNILKDTRGELRLIDWGDVALGPPERDLVYFTGQGFGPFLAEYARVLGKAPTLHPEIFEFYIYKWSLQEIADYGGHILLEALDSAENEHALKEVSQYLPIQHAAIHLEVDEIRDMLGRL